MTDNRQLEQLQASQARAVELARRDLARQQKLAEQGVVIYGVNYKDVNADAKKWLKEFHNPYQLDIDDADGTLGLNAGDSIGALMACGRMGMGTSPGPALRRFTH